MRISGYLQTIAAIHIASSTEGNATGIATRAVPNYDTGRTTRVPFVPPTVLRGLLRKTASDMASEQMLRHNVQIPAEVFNALRHGSNSGRMTNDNLNPSFFDAQRGNPVMGLFGGGPRQGSAGALTVAPMYPLCEELINLGIVDPDPMVATPPQAFTLIGEDTMYPKIDMVYQTGPSFDVIENKDAKIDEFIIADTARRVKDGGASADTSTLRSSNLLTYRFMIPGVILSLNLTVDERSPDHLKGFLIKVLTEALNRNQIGGMQRIGMGQNTFLLRAAASKIKLDDEDLFDFEDGHLIPAAGRPAELVAAFDTWEDDGKAWTKESLWEASGFVGIDLDTPASKKKAKASKKKDAGKAQPAKDA